MPRIDPLQLLKCLSILLSPEGGILSRDEVPRLVNLMTKFSKKLVSKCVYILILKNTDRPLVNLFMAEGGWNLIHTWLQDAIHISNWDLVKEILSLLLVTPVDVERLKLNNIPKLVKSLSRLDEVKGVQELSTQLVHDWLVIVKGNTKTDDLVKIQPVVIETINTENAEIAEATDIKNTPNDTVASAQINALEDVSANETISTNTFYKVTVRDGKQVISRSASVDSSSVGDTSPEQVSGEVSSEKTDVKKESKDKKIDDKSKVSDKNKLKDRSSSSKHSSSSRHKSSSSSHKSSSKDKHKSSSSKSSSSKDRDKKDRDKDRHKANGASSSSSKEKGDSKEKQAEKDKDTLAKIKPQSIDKLGRIPKKTDDKSKENKEIKKPTMSIEVRKNTEERPKTVKVFNSKRRSTGLEEEAKPPPPRVAKKSTPVVLPAIPQKRPSPIRDLPTPPEKKLKVEIPERPGAIKLIPPKPKPPVLQESDIFMDALTASATTKKEPKKRKRRLSVTKDMPGSPPTTPQDPQTPTSPLASPIGLKNIAAPNFYQDTLETEQEEPTEKEDSKEDNVERPVTPMETEPERVKNDGGLRGVLLYTKKKGPKKSVKFNDSNLTQVRFFELDETERVNVTKTFMDMAKMEMSSEREALQMSRKLPNEDTMEPQTMWRALYIIDQKEPLSIPGCKSKEREVQFAREKDVPQVFYYDKRIVPDSPQEAVPENHAISDPIIIPLEDADSQEIDQRNTPWPEPKGSPPPVQDSIPPQIFPNMPMPFQNFPHGTPPPFQNIPPRFGPQNGPGVFGGPPNMMPNGNMMGPPNMGPPTDMMHQGPLNPNAFGPGPDNFNPMINDNNYQMPFNHPPNMGMFPPNNFNMNRGGGRGFRRGGGNNNGPWIRMSGPGPGPGNWNNRGGGNRGGRLCKNIKNHGYCRNIDKCPFIHPK